MIKRITDNPKVIVQGITGKHGSFHTAAMQAAGAKVIAGVVPGGGGKTVNGIAVFNSITDIPAYKEIDVSVIFVPAPYCKAALLEAIAARIPLIICITEGVPVHDFMAAKRMAAKNNIQIIGPNCPGILVPGIVKLGIIPVSVGLPGSVSIVSRSGTLAYEVANSLTEVNIGQRAIIGIGGDPVKGMTFVDCLKELISDAGTESIVLVGEIGGQDEQLVAAYLAANATTKPVYAYIAGHCAPANKQLGHAGAIIRSGAETAQAKTTRLKNAGVVTAYSVPELLDQVVKNNHKSA